MIDDSKTIYCTAFRGVRQIAAGPIDEVAVRLMSLAVDGHAAGVLVFDDATAEQIDLDLRGTRDQILQRLASRFGDPAPAVGELTESPSGADPEAADGGRQGRPGRPKLGVIAREVTLLPRHWDWLSGQPGGASVALRKLVDEARRGSAQKDNVRHSQEAAYRFMSAMAGNQQGFEEAARALFARHREDFDAATINWPADLCKHARKLAASALQPQ